MSPTGCSRRSTRSGSSRSRRSSSPTRTSTTSARWPRSRARRARPSTARSSRRRCSRTSWTSCRGEGFGPFESYDADHTVAGGETLELAGLTIDVMFTPGHSPGHVTYAIPAEAALFSGDVLFQGSVGRVDLPGGDWPTLLRSIESLLEAHPDEATVYPGPHGDHDARARARHQPVPARASRQLSEASGSARHVRRATGGGCAPRRSSSPTPSGSSKPPATAGSRRRRSKPPSCSPAGWGRRPTSSRRRCTRSRTAPDGR